jgi:hypothetical protein
MGLVCYGCSLVAKRPKGNAIYQQNEFNAMKAAA